MRSFAAGLVLLHVVMGSLAAHAQGRSSSTTCIGDCDANGTVEANEIIACVDLTLDVAPVLPCTACTVNAGTHPAINEIIQATNNALNGCTSPIPTATPMNVSTPTNTPVTHTIVVGPDGTFTFTPDNLTIQVGETVEWTWASGGHNVVSGNSSNCAADGRFCSPEDSNCAQTPTSSQGAVYSHTFTAAGAFPYFCSVHCSLGMAGMITVQ